MATLHSLLKRQLKGEALEGLSPRWQALLEAVNTAYWQFDEDRTMLERSMELSSQELVQANAERLAASDDRFFSTFNQAAVGLAHVSPSGQLLLVNRKLCEMLRYTEAELKGRRVGDLSHEDDREVSRDLEARLKRGEIREFVVQKRFMRRDGAVVWVNLTVARVRGDQRQPDYDIAVLEDVTERKRIEIELHRMAKYDPLSGLPNRNLLKDRMTLAISRARRLKQPLGFALFDLDRFKEINDTLGHPAGDELLASLAARLVSLVRDTDTVARLGGDEFTAIFEGCQTPEQVREGAMRLLSLFDKPFAIGGRELYASGSIGVAIFPADGSTFDELLKHADIAMYAAKREGGAALRLYSPELHAASPDGFSMHAELRRALDRGEFELHYQPKIAVPTGRIVGVEALLRWRSPDRGLVGPSDFIHLAEETGLIEPIGNWVIEEACRALAAWRAEGAGEISVAVNLSSRQFQNRGLVDVVARALEKSALPAACLVLEITETVMMERAGQAREVLDALVATGVRVAIDDFGTGYASLSYLRRFPVHSVKIDREFVRDIESDAGDAAIVRAIVHLAHSLGLLAVAEGVENQAQLHFLAELGCDEYQGFHFSAALPVREVGAMLLGAPRCPPAGA
ncbi:hypothetical protein LBMAG42_45920 [Deltaproteobacteria bacterium]|nr:hypothetical protein LBMAG42_45920 [Deltaproteobacteria bacterium]